MNSWLFLITFFTSHVDVKPVTTARDCVSTFVKGGNLILTSSQDVFVLTEQVVFNEMSGRVRGIETRLYRNTGTFSAMFLETNPVILTSSRDVCSRVCADNIRIFLGRHSDIFELFDKTKPGVLSQNSACLKQQHGAVTTSNWKLSLKNRKVLPKRIITHQQAQLFWQHVNLNPGEFRQTDHRVDVVIRWRRTGGINRSRMRSGAFR